MVKPGKFRLERLALISSYGLRWESSETVWPHLWGERRSSRRTEQADFRNQMGLYVLYADRELQYVGIADRLGERIADHRSDWLKDSWNRYSWFGSKVLREGDKEIDRAEPNVAPA